MSSETINFLPRHILLNIFDFLTDPNDKINFSLCSKDIYDIYLSFFFRTILLNESSSECISSKKLISTHCQINGRFIFEINNEEFSDNISDKNHNNKLSIIEKFRRLCGKFIYSEELIIFACDLFWLQCICKAINKSLDNADSLQRLRAVQIIYMGDNRESGYFENETIEYLMTLENTRFASKLKNIDLYSSEFPTLSKLLKIGDYRFNNISRLNLKFDKNFQLNSKTLPRFESFENLEQLQLDGCTEKMVEYLEIISQKSKNELIYKRNLVYLRKLEITLNHSKKNELIFKNYLPTLIYLDTISLFSLHLKCCIDDCDNCYNESLFENMPNNFTEGWYHFSCSKLSEPLIKYFRGLGNLRKISIAFPSVLEKKQQIQVIELCLKLNSDVEKLEIPNFFATSLRKADVAHLYWNIFELIMANLEEYEEFLCHFDLVPSFFSVMLGSLYLTLPTPRKLQQGLVVDFWKVSPLKLLELKTNIEGEYEEQYSALIDGYGDYNFFIVLGFRNLLQVFFNKYKNLKLLSLGGVEFTTGSDSYNKFFYTANDKIKQMWMRIQPLEGGQEEKLSKIYKYLYNSLKPE